MTNRCADCRHCEPFFGKMEEAEPDDVLQCRWEPDGGLPYSWRYAPREVIGVFANDGANCPQFSEREPTK